MQTQEQTNQQLSHAKPKRTDRSIQPAQADALMAKQATMSGLGSERKSHGVEHVQLLCI